MSNQKEVQRSNFYIAETNIGDDIYDILNKASFVRMNDKWSPILGYDEEDDILCVENYTFLDDFMIEHASEIFSPLDFKVSIQVEQSGDTV